MDLGDGSVSLRLVAARRAAGSMACCTSSTRPGADTGTDMLRHAGEEGGVVVRGRIELTVGGETRVLGPGDAYYFTSALPHRFRNLGRRTLRDHLGGHAADVLAPYLRLPGPT